MKTLALRETGPEAVFAYGELVFGYRPAKHHRDMVDAAINAIYRRRKKVELAPRGGAKSTWLTTILPSWLIARFPDLRVGLFSKTSTAAEDFSRGIMHTLSENAVHRDLFGMTASSEKWNAQEWLHAASRWHGSNNVTLFANGIGGQTASKRFDLIICHEKGTPILHEDRWVPVEQHPTARFVRQSGLEVSVWGLPEPEVVTPMHRYWTVWPEGRPGWAEAWRLERGAFIGYPIDYTVESPRGIPQRVNRLVSSGKSGIVNEWRYENVAQPELLDPDWWWLLGLWWGDGHRTQRTVGFTVSDETIGARLTGILDRYGYSWSRSEREGCWQIIFSATRWAEWLTSWRSGNSMKQPPSWVERVDLRYQANLLRGYIDADGFADGGQREVRITSVHLPGLLAARRMFARLGIPASIRRGPGPGEARFGDRVHQARQRFDLRFHDRYGAIVGLPASDQTRWSEAKNRLYIEDGVLWSKVRGIAEVDDREFVPIQTESHDYLTAFGRSHNCDDILTEENTGTTDQREKGWTWFQKTLLPCLSADGTALVVGTRWAEDDLYERLIRPKDEDGSGWDSLVLKALIEDPDEPSGFRSYWPSEFSVERLLELREDMGSPLFSCAYQNDIAGLLEGNIFSGPFDHFDTLPPNHKYSVKMGVDLASSEKERADYTARVTTAADACLSCDRQGEFYILSAVRAKLASGHAAFIADGWEANPGMELVICESVQFQSTLVQEVIRDYPRIPIEGKKTDTDKTSRARAMAAKYEAHKVHHHRALRGSWFETELLGFPKGHDDGVDAAGFSFDMGSGGLIFAIL